MQINLEDEIIRDTLIARDGQVVNPRIQQLLGSGMKAAIAGGADSQFQGCNLQRFQCR